MISNHDASQEFQRRRRQTWVGTRFWMLAMVFGFVGFFVVTDVYNDSSLEKWAFFFFAVIAVSIIRITFVVGARYRCPICDKIPMSGGFWLGPASLSYERYVPFDPTECPSCGAKLKK